MQPALGMLGSNNLMGLQQGNLPFLGGGALSGGRGMDDHSGNKILRLDETGKKETFQYL